MGTEGSKDSEDESDYSDDQSTSSGENLPSGNSSVHREENSRVEDVDLSEDGPRNVADGSFDDGSEDGSVEGSEDGSSAYRSKHSGQENRPHSEEPVEDTAAGDSFQNEQQKSPKETAQQDTQKDDLDFVEASEPRTEDSSTPNESSKTGESTMSNTSAQTDFSSSPDHLETPTSDGDTTEKRSLRTDQDGSRTSTVPSETPGNNSGASGETGGQAEEHQETTEQPFDETGRVTDTADTTRQLQHGDDNRSQSIEDMLLEFDEQEGLIRDRSLLDPNHIVEEDRIVGRDEQLKHITKMLRVALGNNRPPNLFLYGPSGTGKSLITKAVCKNISRICRSRDIRFGTIEVNCQGLDTLGVAVYELVCCAAEEAKVDVTVPKHGVATKEKWDELFRIVNENFDSVVFVLDELDMLVGRRDKQDPAFSRLLYQLSRAGANDELTAHVSVVAISNDTKMMESVGSRALSSFTPEDVHFDDYDANQLQSILRRRRDAFNENALDDDVIPLASAFAAQTHGDARKAIDLMRVAGELAERENAERVREKHVRAAQDKVEKNRVLEVVRGISTQKKLCLYATAAVASETEDGTARSTTGYRVYQFLTDSIEAEQYHQETYVNKMKELTTYSLVDFERRSHGPRSGMFLEFQFGERPETILETLREDSRLDMVSQDEVSSVVQAQIRNQT